MADPKPRGDCPVCGRSIQLKKDGTVRQHRNELTGYWAYGRAYHCSGSGQQPLQMPEVSS